MPIPVTCPRCGTPYNVPDEAAGQTFACTNCQSPVQVGKPGAFPPNMPPPGYAPYPPPQQGGGMSVVAILAIVCVVLLVGVGGLVALLLPAVQSAREAARRSVCGNNLRQIGIALHMYQSQYGRFPPPYVVDAEGRPLYSWRVLILPMLEQQNVYDRFDKNAAWDSPQNRALADLNVPALRCPSEQNQTPGRTSYRAVVSNESLFPPGQGVRSDEIRDGMSNTIAVVESSETVPWSAPDELTPAEFVAEFTGQAGPRSHYGGANVVMADGHVQFISEEVNEQVLRSMISRNGGELIQLP